MSKPNLDLPDTFRALYDDWDGETRGMSRAELKFAGHSFDDVTWLVRQSCLHRHRHFMAFIWKDRHGKRVKNYPIHDRMGDFLDEADARNIPAGVLAPMGLGKSEQGMAYSLRRLCKDPKLRTGIVADKDDHASQRVVHMRRYVERDKDFRRLFPEIRCAKWPKNRLVFRLTTNQTAKDESVEGAGVMSQGTGTRKDYLFFDDCVTAKNAINEPAQRIRVITGYEQTWIGRLTEGDGEPGWHYFIATLYHPADLWHRLMDKRNAKNQPVYAILRIGVSDDFSCYDVEEVWPEGTKTYTLPLCEGFWDKAAYQRKYEQLVVDGDAMAWFTGYKNMVVDPEAAQFHYSDFHRSYQIRPRSAYPLVVMYADPASSDAKKSDCYAGWVAAWDPFHKAMVVLDGWYTRRDTLTTRVNTYLDKWEAWKPDVAAVEGSHELSFGQRIEEMALERGLSFRLIRTNHRRKKEDRITGLGPLLGRAKIFVDCRQYPWLWKEAMMWPKPKNDDALDALEGAWDRIRRAMRRRGEGGAGFSLDAQYDVENIPQAERPQGGHTYRVPDLSPRDKPTRWGRVRDLIQGA